MLPIHTYSSTASNLSRQRSFESNPSQIHSFDPDSVLQKHELINQKDLEIKKKVLIDCFWLIRSGDLKSAQELLIKSQAG